MTRILKHISILGLLTACVHAQVPPRMLADNNLKSGTRTMRAFSPVEDIVRDSVVVIQIDGRRVALGTIVDADGLLVTKASEIKPGALTCTLANGRKLAGTVVATDEGADLALVRIAAQGLKPIAWNVSDTELGEWVATAGVGSIPEAVGIVSVTTRKIPPPPVPENLRPLVGVQLLDDDNGPATITGLVKGFNAIKAGLLEKDVIVGVAGKSLPKKTDVQAALHDYKAGQTVRLRIKRGDTEFDVSVELLTQQAVDLAQGAAPARGRGGQSGRGGAPGGRSGLSQADRMARMGSGLSTRSVDFAEAIQHDTVLEPWQCGGPLIGLDGTAVGINIARADRVASYALPAALVKTVVETLKQQAQTSMKAAAVPVAQ